MENRYLAHCDSLFKTPKKKNVIDSSNQLRLNDGNRRKMKLYNWHFKNAYMFRFFSTLFSDILNVFGKQHPSSRKKNASNPVAAKVFSFLVEFYVLKLKQTRCEFIWMNSLFQIVLFGWTAPFWGGRKWSAIEVDHCWNYNS